ncbi:MAG: hypothetical protein MUF58_04480 [Arcicella sp.]|nr:hypothetical protein [Arcicella sp.]
MSSRFRFLIVRLPFMKVNGMAIFPFLFVRSKNPSKILINHERIHFRQQLELLIIPFYFWYVVEYLLHRIKGKSGNQAYRSISFEREAYQNDENLSYLKNRKWWAFLKYL